MSGLRFTDESVYRYHSYVYTFIGCATAASFRSERRRACDYPALRTRRSHQMHPAARCSRNRQDSRPAGLPSKMCSGESEETLKETSLSWSVQVADSEGELNF